MLKIISCKPPNEKHFLIEFDPNYPLEYDILEEFEDKSQAQKAMEAAS
jgi:hypothetical protein